MGGPIPVHGPKKLIDVAEADALCRCPESAPFQMFLVTTPGGSFCFARGPEAIAEGADGFVL